MKHVSPQSFLSSAKSLINLVIMSGSTERQQVFQKLLNKEHAIEKFTPEVELHILFDALLSSSLFERQRVVMLDDCDLLNKASADTLAAFLEKNAIDCLFLLGAKGKTPLSKTIEKIGSVLDMSLEKPWERDKRLKAEMTELAKAEGKWLSSDAADLLIEKIGTDFSFLSQEMIKLCTFVGDKQNIERLDVVRIGATNALDNSWKIAEEIVWEGGGAQLDASLFFGLIFSLRAQLQMGAKITSLIEAKTPTNEWNQFFPKVFPKTLEKRKNQAMAKGSLYFQKGLDTLFKIEMLFRTGAAPLGLFDLFKATLKTYG